jgi:very-short-patch-repair endonuclease
MRHRKLQRDTAQLWKIANRQHGVITRSQLLELGFGESSIKRRMANGRLHALWRGVYAVGRPEVSQHGRWLAAVLSCGPTALLSHRSAATLWGLMQPVHEKRHPGEEERVPVPVDVVVPYGVFRRLSGIRLHRRSGLESEARRQVLGIPVTEPASTLIDLASCVTEGQLERAINQADRLDLVHPEQLRAAIQSVPRRPGLGPLRRLLDRQGFTDTGLERRFLALARSAGLPTPETQVWVNGYRVDFYWPDMDLVVETDGLRYHRTPGQQAVDRRRDQTHTVAGLTTLRFAESQIRYEPGRVKSTLRAVATRLTLAR